MFEKIPDVAKHTLQELRARADLSQSQAAKGLGITEPTLRKWENDSSVLSYRDMKKVAQFYKIPLDYIFFGPKNAFSEKEAN